jgi:antitoxin (DNA-binding transcriptional repressor) of toxin-antitoxin stability system
MREIPSSVAQTHHGRAIARIVPEVNCRQEEIDSAIEGIMALRKRNGKITFEELRSAREGRLSRKYRSCPVAPLTAPPGRKHSQMQRR